MGVRLGDCTETVANAMRLILISKVDEALANEIRLMGYTRFLAVPKHSTEIASRKPDRDSETKDDITMVIASPSRRGSIGVVIMFAVTTFALKGTADEPPTRTDQSANDRSHSNADHALRITTEAAKNYEFYPTSNPARQFAFQPRSVLRWSNPVAGEIYGNVYLWTDNGRPQVIGSIYQWYSPMTHGSHEFHSLCAEAIEGQRQGRTVMRSQDPGLSWQQVPEQPEVAETKPRRTRQLSSIARRFQITKTDRESVTRQLRLLAQPIYRYGDQDSDIVDGAIYTFVQGTDPEVFLLIESKKLNGKDRWHYAFARMNSVKFVAEYRDRDGEYRDVWTKEIQPWGVVKSGREPYANFGPFNAGN
ncbi:hypothetical protein U8335_21865 [Roseiconus lacunae]|uniref:hypothetical protein n=1 Tax=Roseiconus lacunae TaxID=2605694 RepID=UPI003084768C|nr:hypothetical protein U8335_21865 [Stieleria sp. HD01]